jgi:hypothetical protein
MYHLNTQNDDLLVKVPSLEQILCRGRFRHPGSYRRIPSLQQFAPEPRARYRLSFQCLSFLRQNGWRPAMCRPPTKFTSFPFREREQFLSDGRLHRRERRGDIFKAFALGVDAEEPSHETPENHHPGS